MPENIGSAAYLSRHEDLIPYMCGGIFLEMLGLDHPLYLQRSHGAETLFDRVCLEALRTVDPRLRVGDFLRVVTNDERQFNGPGVRVPMVSLSRPQMPFLEGPLFAEYHSDMDDMTLVNDGRLEHACDAVLNIVNRWERTRVPYGCFKGEPFLTRRGISFDFASDVERSQALFETMFLLDGRHSIEDIARRVGAPIALVEEIADQFQAKGLVELLGSRPPAPSESEP